jgi:hypothetical protein
MAQFFADKIAKNKNEATTERMTGSMNHEGLYFLDITGERLAKGLPFYTIKFV